MATSKKAQKFIIAAVIIVVIAVAAVVICYFVFRNNEPKLVFKTLDKVLAEAPDVLDNEYDNIKLSDGISIDDAPKELYTFTTTINTPLETAKKFTVDMTNRANTLFQVTGDDLRIYEGDDVFEFMGMSSLIPYEENEYTDEMYNVKYDGGGSFMLMCPYLIGNSYVYGLREKYYVLGQDDISDVSYSVFGEQYAAQDAVDYAASVFDKYKDLLLIDHENVECKPTYLIIAKNQAPGEYENDYSYIVRYTYSYKGVDIHTGGSNLFYDDPFRYPPTFLDIVVSAPDKFALIDNCGLLEGLKAEKIEGKYVTLESALDRASNILAPKFVQNITDIDIVYVPKQTQQLDDEGHAIQVDSEITFRPMWRLTTDIDKSNEHFMPQGRYLFIDMVTGEFVLYDDNTVKALTEDAIKEAKKNKEDTANYFN